MVEARDLAFAYGERQALDGLSFAVGGGQIYGFLGPNGGGKTTLFKILATLLRPDRGSVRMLGTDLAASPRRVRRLLGVVFQAPSLDLQLTVGENLIHQGHLYGLRGEVLRRRVTAELERFDLADRRRHRAATLSGGLRRRAEIAKAILHEPRLLLLDEPSTGLDPGARRELWRTLETLRSERGVTVLLTTHFMEEGDRCDRLALLDRGRLVVEGAPSALKAEIGGDVVVVTTSDPEGVTAELAARFGIEATRHGEKLRFERHPAYEFVPRLIETFPGKISAVTVAKPTLEDVFLRHTGHGLWENAA